ncbi:MAG: hypothetical protein JWN33_508 [Candidatus Saccharibacteria bacterium]|nr:hypothetical protein [Candidatus Saccharibacteria bacterium]
MWGMNNVEPERSDVTDTQQLPDRSDLASLYPEVRPPEDTLIKSIENRVKRQYTMFGFYHYLFATIIIPIICIGLIPRMITWSAFGGVFFAFGIALLAVGLVMWLVKSLKDISYYRNFSLVWFISAYLAIIIVPTIIGVQNVYNQDIVQWVTLAAYILLLHYISTFVLIKSIAAKRIKIWMYISVAAGLFVLAQISAYYFMVYI